MSEYVTKEMLEEARKIDLLTYLQNYEPYELVKVSSGTYTTKNMIALGLAMDYGIDFLQILVEKVQ